MIRTPDSLIPFVGEQSLREKWDDKALTCRKEGEANLRAATEVNAVSASSTRPAKSPIQLEMFPGRACPLKAKPAMDEIDDGACGRKSSQRIRLIHRDGVEGGGTQRQHIEITGEALSSLAPPKGSGASREAHKGGPRKRRIDAGQGVGGGHSTKEPRDNRGEGRAATSTTRTKRGKTAGLRPRGSAKSRPKSAQRMESVRKLQRTLYRVAKQEPGRRFPLLYDKIYRRDILEEAWKRVKANGGAAGVDKMSIADVVLYGEQRFLTEVEGELRTGEYRAQAVRRVHIPKPGQAGATRPLGIPAVRDRVVQMAAKLVIEPLFEADFLPFSYGFRPRKSTRMALDAIVGSLKEGFSCVVDVDLKSYFDTIDHELLIKKVQRRVADVRVLRLIRAWLKAGVMEDGMVRNPLTGSPQGGVISPLLSNIFLHDIDRLWVCPDNVRLIRYADDMVLLVRNPEMAERVWNQLQGQLRELKLEVNQAKSRLTTDLQGFAFLGFEIRRRGGRVYMWPRARAVKRAGERIREVVRSVPSNGTLENVVKKLINVNYFCRLATTILAG